MSSNEYIENVHEPLKQYKNRFKELHKENVKIFFKELTEKSKVDVEANKKTNKKIIELDNEILRVEKLAKKNGLYSVITLVWAIAGIISVIVSIMSLTEIGGSLGNILGLILGIASAVGGFLILLKKLKPIAKDLENMLNKLRGERAEALQLAWSQMKPLNDLFDNKMSVQLFNKTLPLVQFDEMLDSRRFDYFVSRYGLQPSRDMDRSTLFLQSGEIQGNPFYITTDLVHTLGTKRYTGSITITYTTTTTVNGKRVTTTRTQTLTASIDKPYPYFNESKYLVYGNEAAPDLSFTRTETEVENMSEKQIERAVRKETKKLEKHSRKQLSKGQDFMVMGNTEFDVLFGALDRDHEVQFRLLFTPLAQQQIIALMKEKELGYGDEFDFVKRKKINIIYPKHMRDFDISANPSQFYHYDYEVIKERFNVFNNEFFRQIYFSFAPVLSIPLYQQQKPQEFIYKDLYDSYISFYEHENVINKMNATRFIHPLSTTRNILKTTTVSSGDNIDSLVVSAFGYRVIKRIDYVRKLGNDGRTHSIPIEWDEFIPVTKETEVNISYPVEEEKTPREKFEGFINRLKSGEVDEKSLAIIGRLVVHVGKDIERNEEK